MKREASVYIRDEQVSKIVNITGPDKPEILQSVVIKWQSIIDLMAKIMDVPSGLIMQINEDTMEVFLKSSNTENPYERGGCDSLGHGLYCERVIGSACPETVNFPNLYVMLKI